MADYPYVWHVKTTLPERKGERCRVEHVSSTKVRVEFQDGLKVLAHRSAVKTRAGKARGRGPDSNAQGPLETRVIFDG